MNLEVVITEEEERDQQRQALMVRFLWNHEYGTFPAL